MAVFVGLGKSRPILLRDVHLFVMQFHRPSLLIGTGFIRRDSMPTM